MGSQPLIESASNANLDQYVMKLNILFSDVIAEIPQNAVR